MPKRSVYALHAPTAKQAAGLVAHRFLPADEPSEVFYGGAAGGGKSDWLLDGALEFVEVPGYSAIIFRRTYTDLALPGAIMARSKEWLKGTDARWNEQQKTWTFPSGAALVFAYLRAEDDVYRYQSAEFQYVGYDELTQFSEAQYTYLFSRLRRPEDGPLSVVPLRMRAASNPGGIGHGWVKARWSIGKGRPPARRVFIPAKLTDNPHLDAVAYEASLRKLKPALAEQLLNGDWDAFEGQAYPELSADVHAVDRLPLRTVELWARHEGMDHGVTNPTAWLLFLTDYDSNLVVADEYYSPGLPSVHAAEVLERRKEWWERRDDDGWPERHIAYGDPASLRESLPVTGKLGDPLTLADEYRRFGIKVTPGNNRRRAGYVHLLELLEPSCACAEDSRRDMGEPDPDLERPLKPGEKCWLCDKTSRRRFPLWHPRRGEFGAPRLFIVKDRCPELWEQLVNAPIASGENDAERGEAVDRDWESRYGHGHAALRYGTLSPVRRARTAEETPPADPRARARWERRRKRVAEAKRGERAGTQRLW